MRAPPAEQAAPDEIAPATLGPQPLLTPSLRVLGAATVGMAFGYSNIAWTGFGLYVIPLSQAHGWTISQISLAFTILALVVVALAPLYGVLLDRFGVRRVVLPSIVLFSLAFASLAFVGNSLTQFYITYAVIAAVGCGTLPGSYARAVIGWFDARRGLALGVMLAGISVGGMLIPPFVQYMIATAGLRGAYFAVAAAILFIAFPITAIFLHERPDLTPDGTRSRPIKVPFRVLWRNPRFLKLVGAFVLLGVFNSGLTAHLVSILVSRGITIHVAALAMSLLSLGVGIGRLAAGWMLDRFFAPHVILGFILTPVVGLLLLAFGATGTLALSCAVLLGIGLGAEIDFMAYLVSRYFPARNYGQISSTVYSTHLAGAALGPPMVAASIQELGTYNPALFAIAAMVAASIPLFLTLGPYPERAEA